MDERCNCQNYSPWVKSKQPLYKGSTIKWAKFFGVKSKLNLRKTRTTRENSRSWWKFASKKSITEGVFCMGNLGFLAAERGNCENCFVDFVKNKSLRILVSILWTVFSWKTLMTDDWGAYRRFLRFTRGLGCMHFVVVHARFFVDPVNYAHIQTVEGANRYWNELYVKLEVILDP